MENMNWRNHVLFPLGQVLQIKWPVCINGFMLNKPGNPAKSRIMLKMALPNGIKTKLIGEKSIQKTGPSGITFFLVFSRFQRRNWWWKLSAGNAWLGRKQEKKCTWPVAVSYGKMARTRGYKGEKYLLKSGCRDRCTSWFRRLFLLSVSDKMNRSFCITSHKTNQSRPK